MLNELRRFGGIKVCFVICAILLGSFFVFLNSTKASAPAWNVTGVWNLVFKVGGTDYPHTMTVSSFDSGTGSFFGAGVYDVDGSYTWDVTGSVSGETISFHVVYTGINAGYSFDATGLIVSGGTDLSGTWNSGTWTGSGTASPLLFNVDDNGVECPDALFTSIQDAIDVAPSGTTITVCSGTYNEDLDISKSVVISGTDRDGVVVNNPMPGGDNYGIHVTADYVTLEEMTIKNSHADDALSSFQIHVSHVSGFVIHNVTLIGNGKSYGKVTGLDLNTVSNITINNVSVQDYSKNGISVTSAYAPGDVPSSNITFSNNIIVVNNGNSAGWAGIAFYTTGGGGGKGDISNVHMLGLQKIFDNPIGIYFEGLTGFSTTGNSSVDIGNTTFSGNSVADIVNGQAGNVSAYDAMFVGAANGFEIEDRVIHAVDTPGTGLVSWELNTVYVTPNSFIPPHTSAPSIQRGIDAVPGSTVRVAAGVFEEQLVINKELHLVGSGAGVTVINQSGSLSAGANGSKNLITVTGDVDVEITGFSLTGDGSGLDIGVYVRDGANANIHDNTIATIGSGDRNLGILVGRKAHTTIGTAVIKDNSISGYGKGGVVVDNIGSSATIDHNTITGGGPDPIIAQNGIQISRGATGFVVNNTVSGHVCTSVGGGCTDDPSASATADGASGILLYVSGDSVEVANNTLTGNQFNIWTVGAAVVNIHDNVVTGASGAGIAVWDSDQWTGILGLTEVGTTGSVIGNNIQSHDYGVLFRDYTAGGAMPSVVAHGNVIVGNDPFGAWSNTAFNAENNWWGACSGPTHPSNPGGAGDPVSDNVDFTPWTLDETCPGTIVVVKDSVPDAAQDFTFTHDFYGGPSIVKLDDDANVTLSNATTTEVAAGEYSITENITANWDLTSLACDDDDSDVDQENRKATIRVSGGEVVTCVFTNTKRGKLTVNKTTVPAGDLQDFTVMLNETQEQGVVTHATSTSFMVVPGTYSVSEANVGGWDETGNTCVNKVFGPGENKSCTITNTKRGKILIDKITVPSGDPQKFEFSLAGGPSALDQSFSLSDQDILHDSGFVKPGTGYSAVEDVPSGWDLSSGSCSDGSPVNNIDVAPGEIVTCTFTNVKVARLVVEKTSVGGVGTFHFIGDVGGQNGFDLTTAQMGQPVSGFFDVFVDIGGSDLTVTETVPAEWSANQSSCAVNLKPGEEKTCSFVNTKQSTLTVVKEVVNDNGGIRQAGAFTLLIDGQPVTNGVANVVSVGSHTVSEVADIAYVATFSGDCNADGKITIGPGQQKTCVVTNDDQYGSISGVKFEDKNANGKRDGGEPGLSGWKIKLKQSGSEVATQTTDTAGKYSFGPLLPGTYELVEVQKPNWTQSAPANGKHTVVLQPEQNVTAKNFGNWRLAKISGTKFEDTNYNGQKDAGESGLRGWVIVLKKDGNEVGRKTTNASGAFTFTNVTPGLYEAVEVAKPGWAQTFPTAPGAHQVDARSGETTTGVDFGNYHLGVIKGVKFNDVNGNGVKNGSAEPGLANWTIRLVNLGNGDQLSTTTAANGSYSFDGLFHGKYLVREELQGGWIPTSPPSGVYHSVEVGGSGSVLTRNFGNRKVIVP